MRPLSLVRTKSMQSKSSAHRPVDLQGAPPASRQNLIWRTRGLRRSDSWQWSCLVLLLLVSSAAYTLLHPAPLTAQAITNPKVDRLFILPEERIVTGTVQYVKSGVIQVNIGELEPLFLSVKAAGDKGISTVKPADKLTIILDKEGEPIDFHRADQPGMDIVIKGRLLQPLVGDHGWAVLQIDRRTNLPYKVAEAARHKVQNIPVGAPPLFLFDGQDIIVDAAYGTEQDLQDTLSKWGKDRKKRGNP